MLAAKRPSARVMAVVAACAALVAAVIAIDSTAGHKTQAAAPPPAPLFTLPSLRDPVQQVSLSAYRGHPVILNFFASWCGPCRRETPLLARFYRASRGNVVIIGVDADDRAPAARPFVSEIGIPETFFLDSRHRIVKRILGDVTAAALTAGVALIDGRSGMIT
jgi:thiol-disulfide isomerase/thioredoxin